MRQRTLPIEKESKITKAVRIRALGAWSDSRIGDLMADPIRSSPGQPANMQPAQTQPRPDPNEKLVKVFDSEEESEAMVVKGLLDSAGIDNNLTAAAMVQDMFPGLGGMIILVREEDAEAARRLIREYQQSPADDDETAEIEIIEEPPQKA
jgi:Putative prokaryotic signal transducing protein